MRTIIVGAGVAGVSAAAAMRRADTDREIVILGDETPLPYRRPPVSKELFRGEKTADQIRIKKPDWYASQRIALHTDTAATKIDPESRTVITDTGEFTYDQLLLATGGRARTLPVSGPATDLTARGIHTLRTVDDVPLLTQHVHRHRELLVIGAGLIGSEIAASARATGIAVTMLEALSLPLRSLLPPALAQAYAQMHRTEGVDMHTDVQVTSIDHHDGYTTVTAADGRSWTSGAVVVAVGMEPATALAEQAGIQTAHQHEGGGIVVDSLGQTSRPGIWAAGDVANFPHPVLGTKHRIEHWQHAQNHGTAVGKAMAGTLEPFVDVPWCWSDQYGLTLQVAGWPDAAHDVHIRGTLDARSYSAFFCDDGVILGAVNLERPRDNRTAKAWIGQQQRPDPAILVDETVDLATAIRN